MLAAHMLIFYSNHGVKPQVVVITQPYQACYYPFIIVTSTLDHLPYFTVVSLVHQILATDIGTHYTQLVKQLTLGAAGFP